MNVPNSFADSYRHIQSRLLDELADIEAFSMNVTSPIGPTPASPTEGSFEPMNIPYVFHLTSVYDHSLQDAFARVFTRILANETLPLLEELLNSFISTSSSSKAFLFDTKAKFFVASDSSPVDAVTLGLCCDYVHMLNQFGNLYKYVLLFYFMPWISRTYGELGLQLLLHLHIRAGRNY